MTLILKIKRLDPSIKMPTYTYADDAAFDVPAAEQTRIEPGERVSVRTGIMMEIPHGYVGLIWDKSGLSHKSGLKTLGGVVDAGYRGEVRVGIVNLSKEPFVFEKNQYIAQMIVQKKEKVTIQEVQELTNTDRGERGFGSTGK